MKELKKQHLEMLQLLESIEVMFQNGNSIHPNSIIRGAIQKLIGMEVDVKNVNDKCDNKQTAVECLINEMNNIKGSSISMNGTVQFIEKELNNLLYQAKAMEKQQIGKAFFEGRLKEIGSGVLFDLQPLSETFNNYYNETFKSE